MKIPNPARRQGRGIILLIAAFKLAKGVLLLAAGLGVLRLLHHDVATTASHWVHALRMDPNNRLIHRLLERLLGVSHRRLEEIGVGTFFYAAVFLTEGTGLALGKRWAEYFTIIITASFLPFEVYELSRRLTAVRCVVVVVNLAVLVYLIARVRRYRTVIE
ncbi:MAG TPA: DUF2127 domain-containing protein [Terriglobia bacterium]|nr:DUF2127 domain-containing protein [Terriglobia bacterium]